MYARLRTFAALATLLLVTATSRAQDRVDVSFQLNYASTVVGQSVFILGSLPELGGNVISKAVKMEPSQWPLWRLTVSLPAGVSYTYRFYRRDDGPTRLGDTTNQLAIGEVISASTPASNPAPTKKAVLYHSGFAQPVLNWRVAGSGGTTEAFAATPMTDIGPGRSIGERRWIGLDVGVAKRPIEFYFTNAGDASRDPGSGTYLTSLDGVFVQNGSLFSYVPAPVVSTWRADYSQTSPPSIVSTNLNNERRAYRVILPRGYNEHTARRYPVIYFHDGQNMFQFVSGTFGTWNAHTTAGALTTQGQMRECIMVGADNGPNRISDYAAPDSGGQANKYAAFLINELKPLIDRTYRTLPDAANTITAGSSMGGQVSLYLGWDFSSTFSKIGAFSGAWNVYSTGFYDRVRASTARRNIRIYLDSGTAGTANDNYWLTMNLRDDMVNGTGQGTYVLERDIKHALGIGQEHNEAAWAARLPDALRYLVPASEDQSQLLPLASGTAFDVSGDGSLGIEDLYAQAAAPRDLNLDGVLDASDTLFLAWFLRRGEATEAASGLR